ncbi:hypothetical protein HYH02_010927 [Chlamydomonas schloesseri]|uniref:Uncharacterized protein n=1 Tax=Chlamydomonas schloesseri TaxID=2026947 RepID=A0A835T6A8_9CHLO|nr:hypothetical protein HYH02_010927 [Chlamydomonas schloesseri]|eukprot:KAG2438226.1 hypothetical protein HYH02_010927 [Chlamydomonas schloesseri]
MARNLCICLLVASLAALASARKLQASDTDVVAIIQVAGAATTSLAKHTAKSTADASGAIELSGRGRRIEILMAVMSRCPDARAAEATMDQVLTRLHSIATVRLVYIGSFNSSSSPYGITCKHGEIECAGNTQQLCAAKYSGQGPAEADVVEPWTRGWRFIMCQNKQYTDIGKEALAESCFQEVGFTATGASLARACWSGPEVRSMLRNSARQAEKLRASVSATIFVDGQYRCTRNGGQWADCPGGGEADDFVLTVCEAYRRVSYVWPEDICGPQPGLDK